MATSTPNEQVLERIDTVEDLSRSRNSSLSRASSQARSPSSASNIVKMISNIDGIKKALEDFSRSKNYRKTRGRTEVKKGLKSALKKRPDTSAENYETASEESSSSDDSVTSYYGAPEPPRKEQRAVKVPPNITDSYGPGNSADFKILSAINVRPLKHQDVVPWIKQILELVKARGTISKTDFNCFLFSKLDTVTKDMIGHINLSTIEPQDFVDYLILRLQKNKTQDSKHYDFTTTARPTTEHKGVLDWLTFVFKLGRENGVSKKLIWRRFLAHLPYYARQQLQTALRKYIKRVGHYPGCDSMFVVRSLGENEIPSIDEEFVSQNRGVKKGKVNLLLPANKPDNAKKSGNPQNGGKNQQTGGKNQQNNGKQSTGSTITCTFCGRPNHNENTCYKKMRSQKCSLCSGEHPATSCRIFPGELPVSIHCTICESIIGLKLYHTPQVCKLKSLKN